MASAGRKLNSSRHAFELRERQYNTQSLNSEIERAFGTNTYKLI